MSETLREYLKLQSQMDKLEVCERIQSTSLRIRELERAIRSPDAPRSLLYTISSLEKVLVNLEREFARAVEPILEQMNKLWLQISVQERCRVLDGREEGAA